MGQEQDKVTDEEREVLIEGIVRAFLRGFVLEGRDREKEQTPRMRAVARDLNLACEKMDEHMSGDVIVHCVARGLREMDGT